MARFAPLKVAEISPREHHEWAAKVWRRMDRDANGSITRMELDCEEFRSILRAVIAPDTKPGYLGGALYERSEMNMDQAMSLCLRKADLNNDNNISFEEFKAFMLCLRQEHGAPHTANLIFALFDLDSDSWISEAEFREIYRFFLGHNPTEAEFQREWGLLDAACQGEVTKAQYISWLQASANPVFRQHAPPAPAPVDGLACASRDGESRVFRRTLSTGSTLRVPWRLNTSKNTNDHCPQARRNYFLRPQSLPELERHYKHHRGFKGHHRALLSPEPPRPLRVLSTDTGKDLNPERAIPGGTMTQKAAGGKPVLWEDHWQQPLCAKGRVRPGTLAFRCPGHPPRWMFADEFED